MGDWFVNVATLIGAAAAFAGLWTTLRGWYRRTLGRRRDRYARLQRLGTLAQLSFFASVLGEPPAMRTSFTAEVPYYDQQLFEFVPQNRAFTRAIFIDRDYYVEALCDQDESVISYSITTRSERFRPTFVFPPKPGRSARREYKESSGQEFRHFFNVTLGRTRFVDLIGDPNWQNPKIEAFHGARTYGYTEVFYFGNPGYYQHFAFTASSAVRCPIGPIVDAANELEEHRGPDENGDLPPAVERFRKETPVTTFTVVAPSLDPASYPVHYGPHGDEVRTLP